MSAAWVPGGPSVAALADHLWQSTLLVALVAFLAHALRHHRARVRHGLWFAASLKFLLPFSLLVTLGGTIPLVSLDPAAGPDVPMVIEAISHPFSLRIDEAPAPSAPSAPARPARQDIATAAFLATWMLGSITVLTGYLWRWTQLARTAAQAEPLLVGREVDAVTRVRSARSLRGRIRLLSTPARWEPGVLGIVRPAILWPSRLSAHLDDRELDAIVAHELAHVARRDNLTAAVHQAVQTLFWFCPPVWIIGARLVDERERACDEHVLAIGSEPRTYAESILKVCEFCVKSPLSALAGVTGANLKKRMEEIMTARPARSLSLVTRLVLVVLAIVALGAPVTLGALVTSTDLPVPMLEAVATPFTGAPPAPQMPPAQDVADEQRRIVELMRALERTRKEAETRRYLEVLGRATESMRAAQRLEAERAARESQTRLEAARQAQIVQGQQTGPQTVSDFLEVAKRAYDEGRIADAHRALLSAISLLDRQIQAQNPTQGQTAVNPPDPFSAPLRVGGDVRPPRKVRDVPPVYPAIARAAGIQGTVFMEVTLGRDGFVKDMRILRSVQLLDQAAMDAVSQWVYEPVTLGGQPVEVLMTVTVNFSLAR